MKVEVCWSSLVERQNPSEAITSRLLLRGSFNRHETLYHVFAADTVLWLIQESALRWAKKAFDCRSSIETT